MFPENLGPAGSVYDTHSKYSDKLFSVANGIRPLSDMSQNSLTVEGWYVSGLLVPSAINIFIHDHAANFHLLQNTICCYTCYVDRCDLKICERCRVL